MTALFIPGATVSHANVAPYISLEEYQHAPTAVDTSTLTMPGYQADQDVELGNVIRRATGWANGLCHQILAATLDVQSAADVFVRRDGTVRLVNDFWPFRELDSFSAGATPSTMGPLSASTPSDVWMQGRRVLVVPVAGLRRSPTGSTFGAYAVGAGSRVACQWGYWNGWFHTTLAAAVKASDMSLALTTMLPQAAAGLPLTIVDGASTEIVTVAPTFTGGYTLPLAAGAAFAHTPGTWPSTITVTELPDAARQAVISLVSALIKTKGTEAYTLPSVAGQGPSTSALIGSGGMGDLEVARDLLAPFARDA